MSKKVVSLSVLAILSLYLLTGCKTHQKCAAYSDSRNMHAAHSQTQGRG